MDRVKFIPVRGTEERIQNMSYSDGQVYFAVDSGKIYVDAKNQRHNVGGNGVAILYGKFPTQDPNESGAFEFYKEQLEDPNAVPHVNDIVLNEDGTFYRILMVMGEILICSVLAVSGGGGGGGVQIGSRTNLKILPVENSSLVNGQPIQIQFIAESEKDAAGEYTDDKINIIWSLEEDLGNDVFLRYGGDTISGVNNKETVTLDLTGKLKDSASSKLTVYARSPNGTIAEGKSYPKYQDFKTSELVCNFANSFKPTTIFNTESAYITFNLYGDLDKQIDFYVGEQGTNPKLIKSEKYLAGDSLSQEFHLEKELDSLHHGAYTVLLRTFQLIQKGTEKVKGIEIDPIQVEIAVKDQSSNLPLIWLGDHKEKYYNYDDIKIPFLVYDPENTDKTNVRLYKNGIEMEGSPRQVSGSGGSDFNIFEIVDADMGRRNYYSISCGDNERRIERKIDIIVEKDPNREMSIKNPGNLKLLFDAKGRSNSESETNRELWSYKDPTNNNALISATFNNFNWYNNGWVADEKNNSCLRISNGAEVKFPIGEMLLASTSSGTQSATIEMQFKIKNVQNYTPLIHNITRYQGDTAYYQEFLKQDKYDNYDAFLTHWLPTQTDEDGNPLSADDLLIERVQKEVSIDRAVMSYVSPSTKSGMCVGCQDAFFSNGVNTVDVSFVEDTMVNLTAIYQHDPDNEANKLLYIYINGMLTGVIPSNVKGQFIIGDSNMIFKSDYCDIDLYKIRVYNMALTLNQVISNYAVDKKDVTIFDQNNTDSGFVQEYGAIQELILKFQGVEKYNKEHPDKPTMPYIIFDTSMNGIDNKRKLPWRKDMPKMTTTVTFVNPTLDNLYTTGKLEAYAIEDGLCKPGDPPEVRKKAVEDYYIHHCPSWTGENIDISVQGTSSQFYPRRNYKLKTKDKNDNINIFLNEGPFKELYLQNGMDFSETNPCHQEFFYMDNYEVGTTKFTMKIDYMESSGSYNTGFANLVANAYSHHPMEDYKFYDELGNVTRLDENYIHSLRTSVQGFPVLAFHKRGEDEYVYIGRYNMNLDKGSDECFGFKPDKKVYTLGTDGKYHRTRDYTECWEMQNNSRGFCSFRDPWNRPELSFDNDPQYNIGSGAPFVADSFEYRYNVYEDAIDMLWKLNSNAEKPKVIEIFECLGWVKKVDSVADAKYGYMEDAGKVYAYTSKENRELCDQYFFSPTDLEPGRQLMLRLFSNWERAVKWVWSTNPDNAISGGTYNKIDLYKYLYGKVQLFLLEKSEIDGEVIENYVEDKSGKFNKDVTYYEKIDGKYFITQVTDDNRKVYEPGKFYAVVDEDYVLQTSSFYDSSIEYFQFSSLSEQEMDALIAQGENVAKHTKRLKTQVTWGNQTFKYDTKEYRLEKFRNEIELHFNMEYLATYFVMTEIFECYDSRGKNSMWASWGPQMEGGDYIWYPIFYDIDTQLGINNTGIPSFTYNVDATERGNYSTSDSVLWNNFYKCFKDTWMVEKYKQLRGFTSNLFEDLENPILQSIDKIERWYQCDPEECNSIAMQGVRPLIALNLDEQFKYLTIYNGAGTKDNATKNDEWYGMTGRISDGGEYIKETTSYHYALQGNRSQSRRQFLTNRIEYLDSWLNVGNYSRGGDNRIVGRISARSPKDDTGKNFYNSDRWYQDRSNMEETSYYVNEETKEKRYDFDGEYWATLTPIRDSYVTIQDDSAVYPSKKFSGKPVRMEMTALEGGFKEGQNYREQLCYIYGINQMKDLGDLYKMYWQEFKIEGDAKKLTNLTLGCDGLMTKKNAEGKWELVLDENGDVELPGKDPATQKAYSWFNHEVNLPNMPSKDSMPLLKTVNLSNIHIKETSPTLDFTSCEKLEDFRATGSNFTQFTFAPGVALNTLYLPRSIAALELNQAKLLKNIVTNYKYPIRQLDGTYEMEQKGLYIEGLTDAKDGDFGTNLIKLVLEGDSMGYDSYFLLEKYHNLDKSAKGRTITMTDVNWSPYEKLVEGDVYDPKHPELFFKDNGHYGLIQYIWVNLAVFEADILNGDIYKLNKNLEVTSNYITSTSMLSELKKNDITKIEGLMYINNETSLDEMDISLLNAKDQFPNLKLFYGGDINQAYSAKFVLPIEQVDKDHNIWTYKYVPVKDSSELSIQKVATHSAEKNIFKSPYELYLPEKLHHDFLGWSTDPTGNSGIITKEAWDNYTIPEGQYDNIFYAIFKITQYELTFYQGENPVIKKDMDYGSDIVAPLSAPWISDADLPLEETYAFRGYSSNEPPEGTYHISIDDSLVEKIHLESVVGPRVFYPVFVPMSVYDNIHEEYYDISSRGIISWKSGYSVKGKLTIPYEVRGIPVRGIGSSGFSRLDEGKTGLRGVTHIFWSDDNGEKPCSPLFTALDSNAASEMFAYLDNLVYFQMPPTITSIGLYCFNNCTSLYGGDYSNKESLSYYVEKAFKNITNIKDNAFASVPMQDIVLGDNLATIGSNAFKENKQLKSLIIKQGLDIDRCGINIFYGNKAGAQVTMPSAYENYVDSKFALTNQTITYV